MVNLGKITINPVHFLMFTITFPLITTTLSSKVTIFALDISSTLSQTLSHNE